MSIQATLFELFKFDAIDLYHLLRLYLSCNLRKVRFLVAEEKSQTLSTPEKSVLDAWACSEPARHSLWQCANILRSPYSFGIGNKTTDPVSYIAYSSAANVAWAFVTHCRSDGCHRHTTEYMRSMPESHLPELMALHLAPNRDVLDRWLRSGELATIYGIPLCKCRRDDLMAKFRARFPRGTGWASAFAL
jgi:hypothetical protein